MERILEGIQMFSMRLRFQVREVFVRVGWEIGWVLERVFKDFREVSERKGWVVGDVAEL